MTTVLPERPGAVTPRWVPAAWWNRLAVLGPVVVFGVLAWNRRWMADDGLIVLRTVRQLLAGNGPVFNIGERVEANTSTLWTYLLTAFGWIPGVRLEWLAVVLGLLCSTGGMLLALDGTRRLVAPERGTFVLPAGALVLIALPPFRDFATSGLETGLITLWIGAVWWLLVRRARRLAAGPAWLTAVLIGLGVLVRPDLALFSLCAGIGLLVLEWRGWRPAVGWLAAAAALPVAYQIFRMGYYGLLTPNTALVKEASNTMWDKGFAYLADFFDPYWLWIPLVLCLALAGLQLHGRGVDRRIVVVCVVPVVAGLAQAFYVIRVGGDFMHGRMLLPALWCLLLPVLAVRVTRATVLPAALLGAYAFIAAGWLRTDYANLPKPVNATEEISDEREFYVHESGSQHPILAEDFAEFTTIADTVQAHLAETPGPEVYFVSQSGTWSAYPSTSGHDVGEFFNIGGIGMLLPLDFRVHDPIGLANPIAAHTTPYPGRRIGHNKYAGTVWDIADSARGTTTDLATRGDVRQSTLDAIRRTLACPHDREMLESVRAPLTPGRFWENLIHAAGRTSLRYDHDPLVAQHC
ncbi:arabinofuranosyltransferase [Amycolatopsis jejuensis]|uniref:arabinofuranosyltransferase n=1 Tax=Amycolatopsis jejuensis TaxID=330084 RepID=UPI001FE011EB|nr:arabinofuranosyltransferase [Amycolatopsis jejuensis]